MYRIALFSLVFFSITLSSFAQNDDNNREASLVDYDAFLKLVKEVEAHRSKRLISLEEFNQMSTEKNTIILDTRSKAMYDAKHVRGAIHINFSDFTQEALERLIPSKDTRILIYCNNNFEDDQIYFPTKSYVPPVESKNALGITMALNIPTYVNLYGYGYKNVYELRDLISVYDPMIVFEGSQTGIIRDLSDPDEIKIIPLNEELPMDPPNIQAPKRKYDE